MDGSLEAGILGVKKLLIDTTFKALGSARGDSFVGEP